MTEPHDDATGVRESLAGRALLACGVTLAVLLPAWFALSAFLIQLDPALNGFEAVAQGLSDMPVHDLPPSVVWSIGLIRGAIVLALLLPLTLAAWLLARAAGVWIGRRQRRDRERYDALVRDAAVLHDVDWDERRDDG